MGRESRSAWEKGLTQTVVKERGPGKGSENADVEQRHLTREKTVLRAQIIQDVLAFCHVGFELLEAVEGHSEHIKTY